MESGAIEDVLFSLFRNPAYLRWYQHSVEAELTSEAAVADFIDRSAREDISPTSFFEPGWFRSRYQVSGANAFLAYLQNENLRLAWPSPVFWPRYYQRRYMRPRTRVYPLVDFLVSQERRSPHPLLDVDFLTTQAASWGSEAIAFEYLANPAHFTLKPHPLFDALRYLAQNPDVALAGVNPLQHYLHHGHYEGRWPNRLFNPAWYRDRSLLRRLRMKTEPLTHYVTIGFARNIHPLPAATVLVRITAKTCDRGPDLLAKAVNGTLNPFYRLQKSQLNPPDFKHYFPESLEEYNPYLPEHILIIRKKRLAIMYTPRCASARLAFWWLAQEGLLDTALRFTGWSHHFLDILKSSREHIANALSFEPKRYQIYKLTRNPISRVISVFRHCLAFPEAYDIGIHEKKSLSFHDFLDRIESTNYFAWNSHCRPQVTALERSERIKPIVLKLEEGLDVHLRTLEAKYGLAPEPASDREVEAVLRKHQNAFGRLCSVGPDEKIPFMKSPDAKKLVMPTTVKRIYELYREDFDASGYSIDQR